MSGPELWKKALRAGLVGGIVVMFLAATGMILKFEVRNLVGGVVTLGKVMMAVPPFFFAYLALRPRLRAGEMEHAPPRQALLAGSAAGAVAGGVVSAFLGLFELIGVDSVRNIFINISVPLVSILTFDKGVGLGALILILGGTGLGAAAAGFRLLPQGIRRPVVLGLVTVLAFGLLQRIIPTILFQLGASSDWLFSPITLGLTYLGAALVFGAAALISWGWTNRRSRVRKQVETLPEQGRKAVRGLAIVGLIGLFAVLPLLIGSILSNVLGSAALFLLMGLGLNIVVGYAGLLDLGYVAFFAVGAYGLALLTGANLVTSFGEAIDPAASLNLTFWAGLPVVILLSMFVGLLIGAPVLRLRGDYLAIVTLGFGEIARVLVESKALQSFTGGPQGLRDVTPAPIFGVSLRNPQRFYYLALVLVLVAIYVSRRLQESRVGRAWSAMREDEQVAEAMGISTTRYKLLAFAMGGAIGCLGGALFAVQLSTVQPGSFLLIVSITVLAVVILGGMGSIPGVIVGAMVLVGVPGLLAEFDEFRPLFYGAVLIAVMILRPEGLIPNVRRLRELHEEETTQDAWLKREAGVESVEAAPVVTGGAGGDEK